ncbi:conjugal transfer protein TraR [Candidatus Wolfebacteria bacterium]|nr:MAG: conjugal transfer protein TraR [Candidatus Wolfebacteria bacterium]
MELTIWILVFVIALGILVKSSDWLLQSSSKVGFALGLSPFVVGVIIVGMGTSLPELVSSFAALFSGLPEVPVANAIGSNIANILLVVGAASIFGGSLSVTKSLIDLDLPLLLAGTALFIGVVADKVVTLPEAVILLVGYVIYLLYTLTHKENEGIDDGKAHPPRPKIKAMDVTYLVVGVAGLAVGSRYLISAVIEISEMLNIATGVIAISAIAIGTSLPELLVSVKAAIKGQSEVALGNIFGSNMFNILVVVGLPGLFGVLVLDPKTFAIGIPTLITATLLFVISGIPKKIYVWEGAFYLLIYVLFMGKLFGLV